MKSVLCCVALLCLSLGYSFHRGIPHVRKAVLRMAEDGCLVIGTRGSPLALAQAYETKRLLETSFPQELGRGKVTIKKIMTKGDSILSQALAEIGGKGLFTKELDVALLDGSVDLCVHSMKDVPTWLAEGTVLPCNLEREETNDVFISKRFASPKDLPDGSVVGSASLRRQAQLLAMNPTLQVVNFRGNVQTRLKKIENGVVDATLLALAGLKRLNMTDLVQASQVVSWEDMLPAVAQGAIGIQCRSGDARVLHYLSALNHPATKAAVDCERAFLRCLDGNCRTPIAGQARFIDGRLHFRGLISKPDGTDMIRVALTGNRDWAAAAVAGESEALGTEAGQEIRRIAGAGFVEYQHAVQAALNPSPPVHG